MSPFFALLLAVPIVAAYLVRAKVQARTVSSLTIFRVLQDPVEVKRRFAVPHGWLSLLLVLLALTALVGSLWEARPPKDVAILLDHSASMQAQDRMADARTQLDQVLEGLQPRDRVALVNHQGRLLVPLTADHDLVAQAAVDLAPQGAFDPASLALASALGEPILIGDGGGASDIQHLPTGQSAPNHGIVAASARRIDGLGGVEVQAQVLNASDEDALIPVQVGDHVEGLWVPARQQAGLTRTLDPTDQVEVFILAEDALPQDDRVSIQLQPLPKASVLLVTNRPDGFLASALRVHPRVDLKVGDTHAPGTWDLVVYEGVAGPLDGRTVSFGVPAEHFGLEGTPVRKPELLRWSFDDPALRFVDLDNVHVLKAQQIVGGEPVLMTEDGALATRVDDDLVIGFALTDTDLALRLAFVNLVANLVDEAAPRVDPPVVTGILDARESTLDITPAGPPPQLAGPWSTWRIALLAALGLLALEAALPLLRRRRRRTAPKEVRRAA